MFTKNTIALVLCLSLVLSGCAFVGPDSNSISLNFDFSSRSGEGDTYHIAVMIVDEDDPEYLKFANFLNYNITFEYNTHPDAQTYQPIENENVPNNLSTIYLPVERRSVFIVNTSNMNHTVTITGVLPGRRKRAIVMTHNESDSPAEYWNMPLNSPPGFLGYGIKPTMTQLFSYSSAGQYFASYELFISNSFELSGNTVNVDLRNTDSSFLDIEYYYAS
jgi:hypothetical protein